MALWSGGEMPCNEENITAEDQLLDKLRLAESRSTDVMTLDMIRDIMEAPQRSPLWFESRMGRLSASIFGIFNDGHGYRSEDVWLKEFLWNPEQGKLPPCAALTWGTEMEAHALNDYWRFMLGYMGPKLRAQGLPPYVFVEQVGFIIHAQKPWRGVSPDGILHTPYWADAERKTVRWQRSLIEIKCPHSLREKKGENRFYDNQIKPEYYDQIQGIMGQLSLPFCDFIMWTPSGFRIVRFDFNLPYYTRLDHNIDRFYFQKMLPAIRWRLEGKLRPGEIRPTHVLSWGSSDDDVDDDDDAA